MHRARGGSEMRIWGLVLAYEAEGRALIRDTGVAVLVSKSRCALAACPRA
jgi:hypothetical protein